MGLLICDGVGQWRACLGQGVVDLLLFLGSVDATDGQNDLVHLCERSVDQSSSVGVVGCVSQGKEEGASLADRGTFESDKAQCAGSWCRLASAP